MGALVVEVGSPILLVDFKKWHRTMLLLLQFPCRISKILMSPVKFKERPMTYP